MVVGYISLLMLLLNIGKDSGIHEWKVSVFEIQVSTRINHLKDTFVNKPPDSIKQLYNKL